MQYLTSETTEQLNTRLLDEQAVIVLQKMVQEAKDLSINTTLIVSLLVLIFLAQKCTKIRPKDNDIAAEWYAFHLSYSAIFTSSFVILLELVVPGGYFAIESDIVRELSIILPILIGFFTAIMVDDARDKNSSTNP